MFLNGGKWLKLDHDKPNFQQGFGRPNLMKGLKTKFSSDGFFFIVKDRLTIGRDSASTFWKWKALSKSANISVTITWYEKEGCLNSQQVVFNDLDLVVKHFIVQNGFTTLHYGNGNTTPDRINIVERVRLSKFDVDDTVEIIVRAFKISVGLDNLTYALVVSGNDFTCIDGYSGFPDCMENNIDLNWIVFWVSLSMGGVVSLILLLCCLFATTIFYLGVCSSRQKERTGYTSIQS